MQKTINQGSVMHIYGFHHTSRFLNPVGFLEDNFIGFGEMKGLDRSQITFQMFSPEEEYDLIISTTGKGKGLHMFIGLNERIVENIMTRQECLAMHFLWRLLVKCLRYWVIFAENIPNDQLVPTHAMMGLGYQNINAEICELFVKMNWTETEMRRQCDATFVGLHVADIILGNDLFASQMSKLEIARRIFFIRRSNWMTFVPGVS